MKKSAASQNPAVTQETNRSVLFSMSKSRQPTDTRKRTVEMSLNQTPINFRNHDTLSDISGDDAEESIPLKRRRISIIHSYAEKVSNNEYKCLLCMKVIGL